ncbi:LacI family DNA-binding transcriptional regulator (plasmid) [Deinococcus taeanensis]|uniref:LacI family DNA-binding transcriptional regulator n=1 Tax=Deinococcus taeanensis TaxID=2737050 RepID=UPI001CDCFC84|nr:LacI family DNA-binding transcriptional regulator [Deinococcus taeanensis]UBV44370.1 LacI family DNA-binding transcriptional regulator [Deinococcus taeanensis]
MTRPPSSVTAASQRVTSLDVSREAGVSQSAVSRAFTPGASISPDTRRRVLEAARRLGYQPNAIARSLVTQRSGIVALIVGELHNPFYPQALTQFAQALEARGKRALLLTHDTRRDVQDTLDAARSYQIEAAIVFPTRLNAAPPSLGKLDEGGVPVLLFNRHLPGHQLLSVACDNYAGGRLAAQVLLDAGARRPAFIGGDPDTSTHQDRLRGFTERLAEAGVRPVATPARAFQYDWGVQATLHLDAAGDRPDAFFGANDIVTIGILDALRTLGRRVPQEVSVIGFDNIDESARLAYRLTTIGQPLAAMVEDALRALEDPQPGEGPRLHAPELIWRDTVAGRRP